MLLRKIMRHKVTIVRNNELGEKIVQENVRAGINSIDKITFDLNTDIKKGDYIYAPKRDEPFIVEKIEIHDELPDRSFNHKKAIVVPKSEFLNKKEIGKPNSVHQEFHNCEVENVAGRDIKISNITTEICLQSLIKTIEDSQEIPEEKKKSLIKKFKTLKDDPYVKGLSIVAFTEIIKQYLLNPH